MDVRDLKSRASSLALLALSVVVASAGCAGGGHPTDDRVAFMPEGTTLERSILPTQPVRFGPKGSYSGLDYGPGWPLITRQDLSPARPDRRGRRLTLAAFVHLTDTHIIDAQSPARAPFLRKYTTGPGALGLDFADAFRCQEALSLQVAESMVQRINSLKGAPVTGSKLSMAISTGDDGDGKGTIEVQNFINNLDGGPITANTSGQGYVGPQDDFIYGADDPNITDGQRNEIYGQYWHPNPVPAAWAGRIQADAFKTDYGYPEYPGLLDAASRNFTATGLRMPWYSGNGNHDGLVQGNFNVEGGTLEFMDQLADGGLMLMDLGPTVSPVEFLECLENADLQCIEKLLTESPIRNVPSNSARKIHTEQDFIRMHLASPPSPGPVGHGFTQDNLSSGKLYYTFDLGPKVVGIMMDTVNTAGGADGSIGSIQAAWLEQEIQKVSRRYYDLAGRLVTTNNDNKLVVLFSHHNLLTMENNNPDPKDPARLSPAEFEGLVHRYPNVVLWVNGHSHYNRVWAHPDQSKRTGGFWELNTAAHIDFPQQARTVEVVDNQDGTLSIFGILIDHMALPKPLGNYGLLDLAAISRELAANDPLIPWTDQIGAPSDRNVELVIKKPF